MKSNTRRHFLKQASTIALGSSLFPLAGITQTAGIGTGPVFVSRNGLEPVPFTKIRMRGELLARALRNYDRLETDIYRPENDFNAVGASEGWPGDKEGRIILGLTLQAQATRREPRYLDEIIALIPRHLNEKGYLGPVMKDRILEQQLSGHGWFLRGLCEYYRWRKTPVVQKYIQDIVKNLALPTTGSHKDYPIKIASRKAGVGNAAGTTQNTVGKWMLSSDIGCDFIFLDGVVQAYSLFPSSGLKVLIEEMIGRFLQMDLVSIQAQTHATLTALRGILRYYETSGVSELLNEVERRYQLYRTVAMTENYENYNWFGRPEWTEPCAIIDSFMLAVQLWQHTGNSIYLEDAHHIYYNAIGHTQRANGGFGLDNCPGMRTAILKVYADEAYWCCTMRGGEGLASAIKYAYFSAPGTLIIPFYHSSEVDLAFENKKLQIKQNTRYPFEGKITLTVVEAEVPEAFILKLFAPSWARNYRLSVNGHLHDYRKEHGFLVVQSALKTGNIIELDFDQQINARSQVNTEDARPEMYGLSYGPLLLGFEGTGEITLNTAAGFTRLSDQHWMDKDNRRISTVYHLMSSQVSLDTGYHKQILFRTSNSPEA